jgi:hypothetical protein
MASLANVEPKSTSSLLIETSLKQCLRSLKFRLIDNDSTIITHDLISGAEVFDSYVTSTAKAFTKLAKNSIFIAKVFSERHSSLTQKVDLFD